MKIKRLLRDILAFSVSLFMFLSYGFVSANAASSDLTIEKAQLNPDFIKYQEKRSSGGGNTIVNAAGTKRTLGEIPSPLKLPRSIKSVTAETAFPSSFDLRTSGKVTSVKDQSSSGSCWAFATYGSLESNLLTAETRDFSENNLKNNSGFSIAPNDGGNRDMSTAYLARWSGPINEGDDPYNPYSTVSPTDKTVQKHIQEVLWLPDRAGSIDNDGIKSALITYGAVDTSMFFDWNCYNFNYKTFYKSQVPESGFPINHAVTIVGWDDNFDRNKFKDYYNGTVPSGNGAFIIKNSWGSSFGENGYFYISYYDACAFVYNTVFNGAESTENYSRVYQYDPLGWDISYGYDGNNTAWFANVFTAATSESLAAVSFYTPVANSSYEVYVCSNYTGTNSLNSRALKGSGIISLPGYHTINLNTVENLTAGNKFAVIVRLTTPGYDRPIPGECALAGYTDAAASNSGESFYSLGGSIWGDLHSINSTVNVCLKAFTKPIAITGITPIRYGGIDRFETAVKVSRAGWNNSDSVVLATAYEFADALAGVPFAYLKNAPILLTYPNFLPDFTMNEITRLGAKNIYILGGTGVISASLENALKISGYNVYRYSGIDRFETAIAAADQVLTASTSKTAVLTTAYNYPDALSISPYAAINKYPVLYTDVSMLNEKTKNYLIQKGITKVIIPGLYGAVSQETENRLKSMGIEVQRIGGADRYLTSYFITNTFRSSFEYDVMIASGENFPDALSGAAFAAKMGVPILLVSKDNIIPESSGYIKSKGNMNLYIIGGTGVISDRVINQVK